jgi:hypothetical protein
MALTLRSAAVYIISMNRACPMPTKLYLSAAFLGGVVLLFSSRASVRNQNMRTTTLAGLLLLLWVGLNLAGFYYLPVARSVPAVTAFYFTKHLLAGICAAMLIFNVWPKGAKTLLLICGLLFLGFNLFAAAHYDLRHLSPAIRLFLMGNGLVIGMATSSAVFLWLENIGKPTEQNDMRVVPDGTARTESDSSRHL